MPSLDDVLPTVFIKFLENHPIKPTQCKWFIFNEENSANSCSDFGLLLASGIHLFRTFWKPFKLQSEISKLRQTKSFKCRKQNFDSILNVSLATNDDDNDGTPLAFGAVKKKIELTKMKKKWKKNNKNVKAKINELPLFSLNVIRIWCSQVNGLSYFSRNGLHNCCNLFILVLFKMKNIRIIRYLLAFEICLMPCNDCQLQCIGSLIYPVQPKMLNFGEK